MSDGLTDRRSQSAEAPPKKMTQLEFEKLALSWFEGKISLNDLIIQCGASGNLTFTEPKREVGWWLVRDRDGYGETVLHCDGKGGWCYWSDGQHRPGLNDSQTVIRRLIPADEVQK